MSVYAETSSIQEDRRRYPRDVSGHIRPAQDFGGPLSGSDIIFRGNENLTKNKD